MTRFLCGVWLFVVCVSLGTSRLEAGDSQPSLFERRDPHCRCAEESHRCPTVRGQSPGAPSGFRGLTSLPRGRAYYNNRYFGNFNNRFYGPQYGYF